MAIFEKTPQTKAIIDDTENLSCIVENAQNVNKHTEYNLRVVRGVSKEDRWVVSRRYRDFASLHASLAPAHIDLPLPPKKLIGNMHPSFIAERQIALQNYINEVLKHPILALSSQVRSFLDPSNYPATLAEQALQTVSIALRGEGRYELKGPAGNIGWRIRKHYFYVCDTASRADCLLAWQSPGADRYLSDKDLQAVLKSLHALSHPNIDKILAIHSLESGAYVVRRIHENGSIRDMLYGTDYCKSHLAKYGNPKIRRPFTMGQIAQYGGQILDALKFLHDKGLPHGHIHPGNIVIENQTALLTDVESSLLGAASLYRPYLLEHRHTTSTEAVDAHCFGRTLYEMALAEPLNQVACDYYPVEISEELESVLRLCLSTSSCKHGMPTLQDLSRQPLFARARVGAAAAEPGAGGRLKLPGGVKEGLRRAAAAVEARMKGEQKLVRSTRREVRIQEILNSEVEMKKARRRAKKRDSIWKSTSSLAETVRSASTASSPTPPNQPADAAQPSRCHSSAASSCSPAPAPAPPPEARSALLTAICGFDKSRLARVNSG